MMAEICLKVDLDGDIRRLRVKDGGRGEQERWEALNSAICGVFELPPDQLGLKYKDEDGDMCTLAKGTLHDCVSLAKGSVIRLWAKRVENDNTPRVVATSAGGTRTSTTLSEEPLKVPLERRRIESRMGGEVQPPSLDGDVEDDGGDGPSRAGVRGVGPWKLLASLGSLRETGKMTVNMLASLTLQFLPIIAQRAHRKQEKLNRVGPQYREVVTPLLQLILVQVDKKLLGFGDIKVKMETFISGADTSKLGDCLSHFLRELVNIESKTVVASVVKAASSELCELLPKLFHKAFECQYPPLMRHVGTRCAVCGVSPILGPRFHNAGNAIDICGECHIDYPFEASNSKFECLLSASRVASPPVASLVAFASHGDQMMPPQKEHMDPCNGGLLARKDNINAWQDFETSFADLSPPGMTKAKGSPKGASKGGSRQHPNRLVELQAADEISQAVAHLSYADLRAPLPPGLDLSHLQQAAGVGAVPPALVAPVLGLYPWPVVGAPPPMLGVPMWSHMQMYGSLPAGPK